MVVQHTLTMKARIVKTRWRVNPWRTILLAAAMPILPLAFKSVRMKDSLVKIERQSAKMMTSLATVLLLISIPNLRLPAALHLLLVLHLQGKDRCSRMLASLQKPHSNTAIGAIILLMSNLVTGAAL